MAEETIKRFFAAPDGSEDATCLDPSEPGTLANAVATAMATGPGNTVYLKLPYEGAGVTFNENLTQDNDIHKDLTFDTYYLDFCSIGLHVKTCVS